MPTPEQYLAGYGEPTPVIEREVGPRPELPFQSSLLHKLNLIVWAEGGYNKACRAMRVPASSTLRRWRSGKCFPKLRWLVAIDARYRIAFEKHRIKLAGKARRSA